MAEPFIGEIQAFAFGFWPQNWLPCDGRLLPLQSNISLFSLIGATYGGNGTTNFALPNLVAHVAMSQGKGPGLTNRVIATPVGESLASVSIDEMPRHSHQLQLGSKASANGVAAPTTGAVGIDPSFNGFVDPPANTTLAIVSVAPTGRSQPHDNSQPTLAMIYCICVKGHFPSFG